jgi:hypothetical protein
MQLYTQIQTTPAQVVVYIKNRTPYQKGNIIFMHRIKIQNLEINCVKKKLLLKTKICANHRNLREICLN